MLLFRGLAFGMAFRGLGFGLAFLGLGFLEAVSGTDFSGLSGSLLSSAGVAAFCNLARCKVALFGLILSGAGFLFIERPRGLALAGIMFVTHVEKGKHEHHEKRHLIQASSSTFV